MAASGSFSKVFSTGYTLKIAWSESNVDTANNQSDITVTAYLITSGSYHINSTASKKITLTINGTPYSGTCTVGISSGETLKLYSATVSNINHNSDGSKSISIACTLNIAVTLSGSYVSSVSASGTAALTTIARKSTLSASNGTLGTAQDLTVSRKDSGFTHTITYKCGSTSGTVCTKSSSTTISFTPPLSLASQNTTGTTVSIVFTITTYNSSGTSLGSNTKTITCSIPSTVVPAASFTVEDAQGYLATYGGYVQNKSQFAIKVTANGVYSSTIKSYKVVANGKTYTTASVTTGAITSSGTLKITVTVTDSRGRTATVSKEVTVLAYSSPKISSLAVKRTNSSGVASSSGEYLTATFKATVSSLNNKNTVTYVLKYKKKSETEYTSVALTAIEDNYSVTYSSIFEAEKDSSYDVIIVATDAFDSVEKSSTGAPVNKVFSVFKKGLGFAIGKIAELSEYFDVAWNSVFRKNVEIEGTLITKKGHYVHTAVGTSGSTGYVKIAQIAINGNYANAPITVELAHRGYRKYTLEFRFLNADTTDPNLVYFYNYTRPGTGYLYKSAAGVWDLYIQKSDGYDNISVVDFYTSEYMLNKITVTWTDEHADSLPDGYIEPIVTSGMYDSSWQEPTFSSQFEHYNSAQTLKYRRIGNTVEIRGACKPTSTITGSVDEYLIFTLPDGYRPSHRIFCICQGSGVSIYMVSIATDGSVYFSRCREGNTYVDATTTFWLPINVQFFVD